jgi:uncharacterized protein YicC (UPF0701 family)
MESPCAIVMDFQSENAAIKESAMSKRDAYVDKVKAKLDEWNAEIDKLNAKARAAEASSRVEYDEQIERLKKHRSDVQRELEDLQQASRDAWGDFQKGVESAWDSMDKAVRDAWKHFR